MSSLLIRDLQPGTQYALQIRSKNDTAVSEWSPIFEFQTVEDTTPPSTPTGFTFVTNESSFDATWNAVTTNDDAELSPLNDLKGYRLELTAGVLVKSVFVTDTAYTLTFEKNRALFGTAQPSISAKLFAVDTTNNESDPAGPILAINAAPSPVTNLVAIGLPEAIQVIWDKSPEGDIAAYRLSASITGSGGTYIPLYEGLNTTFTLPTSDYAQEYFFRVVAVDIFGSTSTPTTSAGAHAVNSFNPDVDPPDTPTSVTVSTGFDSTAQRSYIDVSWVDVTADIESYIIRYANDTSHWNYVSAPRTETSHRLYVDPNKNYYVGVAAQDYSGNVSSWGTPATNYPIHTAADTSAPNKPSTPTVASNTMHIQVSCDGLDSVAAAMAPDTQFYKVYASTVNPFTDANVNAAHMVGTIPFGPAIVGSFPVPAGDAGTPTATAQTWYVRVVAVDSSGNSSPISDQNSINVPLIDTANISYAAITDAKIENLSAAKIEAGEITAADIIVRTSIQLGTDALNPGGMESWDYDEPTETGFRLASDGLHIYDGIIEAKAIRLQNSANIMPNGLSSFELDDLYYIKNGSLNGLKASTEADAVFSLDFSTVKYGLKSFKINQSAATARTLYLTPFSTTNNIYLPNEGEQYFVSFWVYPTVSDALVGKLRNGSTVIDSVTLKRSVDDVTALATNVWQQVYFLTSGLNLNSANIAIDFPATIGIWNIDCVQFERKAAGSDKPGAYAPPSVTEISGGMIKTGAITSNTFTSTVDPVTGDIITGDPTWSIDMEGDATLNAVQVNGSVVVGNAGEDPAVARNRIVRSGNYDPLTGTGWIIRGDGTADFNDINVGRLTATTTIDGQYLGEIEANKIKTGELSAEMILTGSLKTKLNEEDTSDLAQVVIDGQGVRVLDYNGITTTNLGSDGTSTFEGVVNTDSLNVDNALRLSGDDNVIMPTGIINLAGKTGKPAKPGPPIIDWDTDYLTNLASFGTAPIKSAQYDSVNSKWILFISSGYNYSFVQTDADFTNPVILSESESEYFKYTGGVYLNGDFYSAFIFGEGLYLNNQTTGDFYLWPMRNLAQEPKVSTDGTYIWISELLTTGAINQVAVNTAFSAGSNKVTNGGFETNTTGWAASTGTSLARGGVVAHTGSWCLRFSRTSSTGTTQTYSNSWSNPRTTEVAVTFSHRASVAGKDITAWIYFYDSSNNFLGGTGVGVRPLTTGWTTDTFKSYGAPAGTANARVAFSVDGSKVGEYFYIDDVSVVYAPYNPQSIVAQTGINYGTKGVLRGVLHTDNYPGVPTNMHAFAVDYNGLRIVDFYNASNAYQANYRFVQPDQVTDSALGFDGTNMFSFTSNGLAKKHENGTIWTTESAVWWWGYAWHKDPDPSITGPDDTGPWHTPMSTLSAFNMKKRARLSLRTNGIPNHGNQDDPNGVRFFLNRGATLPSVGISQYNGSQPVASGVPFIGPIQLEVITPTFTASGSSSAHYDSAHLPDSPFPDVGVPGQIISSDDGTGYINLKGDGSGRIGPMAWNSLGVKTSDSGWVAVTAASGTDSTNSKYRMVDAQCVEVRIDCTIDTGISSGSQGSIADKLLFTVPTTGRPGTFSRRGVGWYAGLLVQFRVGTDGGVYLESSGTSSFTWANDDHVVGSIYFMR